MKKTITLLCLSLATNAMIAQTELLTNGSFEDGDLTGWTVSEVNGTSSSGCVLNWGVLQNSTTVCSIVPEVDVTDGTFAAFSSFDSDAVDTEWVMEQTVTLPAMGLTAASIEFDFTANFDFSYGASITTPRILNLDFYTTTGTLIGNIFTDNFDDASGDVLNVEYSQNIDVKSLLSGLQGTDVVLKITAIIPESATGPSKAMIDAVSFMATETLVGVDENNSNMEVSIFPNPIVNTLNLATSFEVNQVVIYDLIGKVVFNKNVYGTVNNIDVSDLTSGSYLLKIVGQNNSQKTLKFVKG